MCKMTGFAGRSKHTGTGVCVDVYGCYAYTRHHPKQNRPNERGSLSWLSVSRATIWELISRRVKLQWMASVFGGGIMWDTSNPSQHSKKKVKVKHNNKKKEKEKICQVYAHWKWCYLWLTILFLCWHFYLWSYFCY